MKYLFFIFFKNFKISSVNTENNLNYTNNTSSYYFYKSSIMNNFSIKKDGEYKFYFYFKFFILILSFLLILMSIVSVIFFGSYLEYEKDENNQIIVKIHNNCSEIGIITVILMFIFNIYISVNNKLSIKINSDTLFEFFIAIINIILSFLIMIGEYFSFIYFNFLTGNKATNIIGILISILYGLIGLFFFIKIQILFYLQNLKKKKIVLLE